MEGIMLLDLGGVMSTRPTIMGCNGASSEHLATTSIHRDAGYAHPPGQSIKRDDPVAAEGEIWPFTRAGRAAMSHQFGEIMSINPRVGVLVVRRAMLITFSSSSTTCYLYVPSFRVLNKLLCPGEMSAVFGEKQLNFL
jgi:hypothetical protein